MVSIDPMVLRGDVKESTENNIETQTQKYHLKIEEEDT